MTDLPEAPRRPTPPNGSHHAHHARRSSPPALPAHSHEATFVRPADYLRPRTGSRPHNPAVLKPERPIDRDERAGIVRTTPFATPPSSRSPDAARANLRPQSAIRNFLKARACYEVLPLSFRLIELDVSLTVKESLNILIQNGIVSAPLWDSTTSTYAGLLTVTDYLNVVQYYNLHADKLKDLETLLLRDLREIERILNVRPPETVSTSPQGILYDALKKMLHSRARRIPLVSYDGETARANVTSVITQYRILKFIAINVLETDKLRKPLKMLSLGSYKDLCRCSMDTTVLDVIDEMVTRNISSVPVVTTDGILLNVFEAVDVINILKTGEYENLNWTVGAALSARPVDFAGIYTCSQDDGLDTIFDTVRKSRVHRLMVVDEHNYLKGVLSLSDILQYILIDGAEEIAQSDGRHAA